MTSASKQFPSLEEFNELESVSVKYWKPKNKGDTLRGVVVDQQTSLEGGVYTVVETPSGDRFAVTNHAVLDRFMRMPEVDVGVMLVIEYVGDEKRPKSGRMYHDYKVFVKPSVVAGTSS